MNALAQVDTHIVTSGFVVPMADSLEFARLPEARRNEVSVTLRLLERVQSMLATTSLHQACIVVASASNHLMRGCSAMSLRRKFEAYRDSGNDWHSLVLGYKGPVTAQPREFLQYVQRTAEENQRSMAAAFDLIRNLWREGHPIPGYGTWVEYYMGQFPERPLPKHWPAGFYPQGWSDRTLYRKAPSKGARMLYQRGFAAAKKHFPSVKRDPSNLRPLELVVIDDFELDCLCVYTGDSANKPQIGRVAGLLAMDVGTRKKLHWGIGQRLEREEQQPDGTVKTVRTGISRVDVQHLLHGLFAKYGLPAYQVTILCENASAAIAPELELALSTLFEGRVKVDRTGLIEQRTLTNGFLERGGRPWDKGWIESTFNALWNQLGNMPGYKGNNARLNAPAELNAKLAYTRLLIGQGEKALNLPAEQLQLLRLPFPSPQAVEQSFAWACASLDVKTDHKYLGFDKVTEFQITEGTDLLPFSSLALLSPEQQLAVKPIERMESPLERWSRLSCEHTRTAIPASVLALLLLTPKRVAYRNAALSFVHGKTGYSYVDADGQILSQFTEGTEFLGYFDQNAPENLHVATLQGAYVGSLQRLGGRKGMVDIRDREAIKEAGAVQAKIVNRTLAQIRERHTEENAQLAQDRAHNASIVAAHKSATASLSKAERIGLAAGESASKAIEQRKQASALARASEDLDATNIF
jgi:hypothetical protein